PTRLALHGQVSVRRDIFHKLRSRLLEVKDDRKIINDFYPLLNFLGCVSAAVGLRNAQESTPKTPVSLHRFWLGNHEHRTSSVFGREWSPVVMELHTLTQRDR